MSWHRKQSCRGPTAQRNWGTFSWWNSSVKEVQVYTDILKLWWKYCRYDFLSQKEVLSSFQVRNCIRKMTPFCLSLVFKENNFYGEDKGGKGIFVSSVTRGYPGLSGTPIRHGHYCSLISQFSAFCPAELTHPPAPAFVPKEMYSLRGCEDGNQQPALSVWTELLVPALQPCQPVPTVAVGGICTQAGLSCSCIPWASLTHRSQH